MASLKCLGAMASRSAMVRATFKLRSMFDRGHFDMDIDAVEQRAGNF
jgi:hypothetical protein